MFVSQRQRLLQRPPESTRGNFTFCQAGAEKCHKELKSFTRPEKYECMIVQDTGPQTLVP